MAKAPSTEQMFVFLGSRKGLFEGPLPARVSVCHDRSEVAAAVSSLSKHVTLISFNRAFTDILLEKTMAHRAAPRGAHLLTLTPPRSESIPALLGLFHPVCGLVEGFRWLAKDELVKALMTHDASDRFIGGSADSKAKALMLLRGNLETMVVPYASFQESGDGLKPDFTKLGFTDYGWTIALGAYESSADAVLYEWDPDYRRTLNKERRQSERTFGAALLRLRTQRRLRRGDFAPLSAKEVARIERGEIEKPHRNTLELLARRLGVRPEEIGSY